MFTEVVAQADRLRDTDTSLAAQLYLTAYRMQPTPALYTSLLETENDDSLQQGHVGIVRAISDDGATLASAGDDGTIQLWSAAPTPALLARITQNRPNDRCRAHRWRHEPRSAPTMPARSGCGTSPTEPTRSRWASASRPVSATSGAPR